MRVHLMDPLRIAASLTDGAATKLALPLLPLLPLLPRRA